MRSQMIKYLTVEEISGILRVHWQTTLNYIKSGELEAIKLGQGYRVSPEAFNKFLAERSTKRKKK